MKSGSQMCGNGAWRNGRWVLIVCVCVVHTETAGGA